MRRKDSTVIQLRQRIPSDVLDKARGKTIAVPIGDSVVSKTISSRASSIAISLRTRDPREAKERHAKALAALECTWNALRNGPIRLTQKQVVALSGVLYRQLAPVLEENPGSLGTWEKVEADNLLAIRGEFGFKAKLMIGNAAQKAMASLEERFSGFVDALLAQKQLVIDAESRWQLLIELARSMTELARRLQRAATGDYSPDVNAQRYPPWEEPKRSKAARPGQTGGGTTLTGLFEGVA